MEPNTRRIPAREGVQQKIMDDWFTQRDVIRWATAIPTAEFLPVYRKTYSLIERHTVRLLGLPRAAMQSVLSNHEYNAQVRSADLLFHKKCRGRTYCPDRISKRLFTRPGVTAYVDGWFDTVANRYLTTNTERYSHGRTELEIAIRRDVLEDDLRRHHRYAVISLSSFRFTEKSLTEMGLEPSREILRTDTSVLLHKVGVDNVGQFRMQSLSIVEGKITI